MQKLSLVCEALQNSKVVAFMSYILESSYSSRFTDHIAEVNLLIHESLSTLVSSQESQLSITSLQKAGVQCNLRIFKNHNQYAWFDKSYRSYRSNIKTKYEYSTIKQYVLAGTVLDFGSGDGYFAEFLTKQGHHVWGTDIKDYRSPHAKDFSFSLMRNPRDLRSIPPRFDNTIVKSVLHHIHSDYIEEDITLLRQKTQTRLIIKEDICSLDASDSDLPSCIRNDLISEYLKLNSDDQLQYLALMDFFGNFVVQGLTFINLPFNFQSISFWRTFLSKHGFSVVKIIPKLFDLEMFHPGPHVWFVCDVVG